MSRFYLFVNGIRTDPEDQQSWPFRAERWVERETPDKATTYHYHTFALTRWLEQRSHIKKLAELVLELQSPGRELVLVGHSNGCDLICRMLKKYWEQIWNIEAVHLIAAATDPSMKRNGLNSALWMHQVKHAHIYYDPRDPALLAAKATSWIPFLRYGHLGLRGPEDMSNSVREQVSLHHLPGWGHSDYFASHNFHRMMRFITTE